jgi:hypothetical protein
MGLNIYTAADPATKISTDGDFTNPFVVISDGKYGTVFQKKLYIRNDDNLSWFSSISLQTIDTVDTTIVDGSKNITWKLSAGDTQPLDDQWNILSTGNTVAFSNIGSSGNPNTSTYLPFWIRVQTPRNLEVQTILDVQFKISCIQNVA